MKSGARLLRQAASGFAQALPRRITALPYEMALRAVTRMAARHGARAWCRNSYRLGHWSPGASDLDLTICSNGPDPLSRVREDLGVLRRLMPWIGEANYYAREEAALFLGCANPLELQRDPQLMSWLGVRPAEPAVGEVEAFLLRMLEADSANLTRHRRAAKWGYYLSLAGKGDLPAQDWVEVILSRCFPNGDAAGVSAVLQYLQSERQMPSEQTLTSEFWAAFPNRACATSGATPPLDGFLARVFEAQLRWEVWGLLGQLPELNASDVCEHIKRLISAHDRGIRSGEGQTRRALDLFCALVAKKSRH